MQRVALIAGISGQDGTCLSEFLLQQGYRIHGIVPKRRRGIARKYVTIHTCDLGIGTGLDDVFEQVRPDEVYNLAAQSSVHGSFAAPIETANITGLGAIRLLVAAHTHQLRAKRRVRFFQASSCEIFGRPHEKAQDEQTPLDPLSPYACAKALAHKQTQFFRREHGMFACNGILFHHESPYRREHFVARKITRAAARIKLGLQETLTLGNLDVWRDWGYAGDYVKAMWLMLQQPEARDYVIATGKAHSIRELLAEAFAYLELDWNKFVRIDAQHFRPVDVAVRCGNASQARAVFGWQPEVPFRDLVRMMVDHDLQIARQDSGREA